MLSSPLQIKKDLHMLIWNNLQDIDLKKKLKYRMVCVTDSHLCEDTYACMLYRQRSLQSGNKEKWRLGQGVWDDVWGWNED